jgi:hypothetical protein
VFKFAADRVVQGHAYPALAQHTARPYTQGWREFGQHWPGTVPCELINHCRLHGYPYELQTIDQVQGADWLYAVQPAWFDHDLDYVSLIPNTVRDQGHTVVFYYHEGDDPGQIHARLTRLFAQHGWSSDRWRLITGNTQAQHLSGSAWFADHELLYWARNRAVAPETWVATARPYCFTVLNRTHKWWRATVMSDLWQSGVLASSQWSYNWDLPLGDDPADNPIETGVLGLDTVLEQFQSIGTQRCDLLDPTAHNDHHGHWPAHYRDSYCNIVVETHWDADGSGGAFLTEKTFKPIRHAQPFVIAGTPGSIAALRALGYRTFDHVVDHTYDTISNNTDRWRAVRAEILRLQQAVGPKWLEACAADVLYNQQHFLTAAHERLNTLYDKLLHQLATT